ncbi:MAG: hypothetical protein ACOC04_01560 [Halothece sp.]
MLTANQQFAQPSLSAQAVNQSDLRIFNSKVALTFGVNEAIFINRLRFWQSKGYGILHDGKRWIYNTYEQWITKEMPWLKYDQFKRMVQGLRNSKVLLVQKLKNHQWYQVNFYAIDEEELNRQITAPTASGIYHESSWASLPDDLYTVKTTDKTESLDNTFSFSDLESDPWFDNEEEATEKQESVNSPPDLSDDLPNSGDDPSSEPIEKDYQLEAFHKELLSVLQFCSEIYNPWAYAQKCVDNLRAGSASSIEVYEKWAETGKILLEDILSLQEPEASETGKNSASVQPNEQEVAQHTYKEKKREAKTERLKEWQIQPEDEELLAEGYEVGDIYPEFVQWAVPRLKYHPDLSDYAAKAHAIKKLKLEPQLALEMWRDFKRLLVREVQDKREKESKGQPYFTPAWMQLPADVPVSEARKASVELSEVKAAEQQALADSREHHRALPSADHNPPTLNAASDSSNANHDQVSALPKGEAEKPPSWLDTVKDILSKGWEWLSVKAINDAIADGVTDYELEEILKLARDCLSLEGLNQICLEF